MKPRTPRRRFTALLTAGTLLTLATAAHAAPVAGFREDFPGTSTGLWGGGAATFDNPGTGGADGVGDGYLRMSQSSIGNFGARAVAPEYAGDWIAAGIQKVRIALNDIGTTQPFQMHFCIGNSSNFWQYNTPFTPPPNTWQDFEVDLSSAGSFTQIIGPGTYTQALQNADRILIRYDIPPYVKQPDDISGDLGIDRIQLIGVPVPAEAATWGRLKALYRDR